MIWSLTVARQDRAAEALESVEYSGVPPERRVLVTTAIGGPPATPDDFNGTVLTYPGDDLNISKWWNFGQRYIMDQGGRYMVNIDSDAKISKIDLAYLHYMMTKFNFGMVGADWHGTLDSQQMEVRGSKDPHWVGNRFPGVTYLADLSLGLFHDEDYRWWLADNDFLFQYQAASETALIGGTTINHGSGTPLDEERSVAFFEDLPRFQAKWGHSPLEECTCVTKSRTGVV